MSVLERRKVGAARRLLGTMPRLEQQEAFLRGYAKNQWPLVPDAGLVGLYREWLAAFISRNLRLEREKRREREKRKLVHEAWLSAGRSSP